MRTRSALVSLVIILFATSMSAADRWVAIAGTVNNFHTDARIFNPSFDKDITVNAVFLPVGNVDNSGRIGTKTSITIPKRQQKVLDDVVTAVFNTSGLGGIFFTSTDEFEISSRIYAIVSNGTLGQFAAGLTPGQAMTKGVLLQMKSNTANRTNIGALNPSAATANVTWKLYDKNNAVVATRTDVMPPYAVIGPQNAAAYFNATAFDLSDAWVGYVSDTPIFAYVSAIDNGTTDPTFIPAFPDAGVAPTTPAPSEKTFDVTLRTWAIEFSPALSVKKGDKVKLRVRSIQDTHGFQLIAPDGSTLVPGEFYTAGQAAREYTFTVDQEGRYLYFCTNGACGIGHGSMSGQFDIGAADDPPGRGY